VVDFQRIKAIPVSLGLGLALLTYAPLPIGAQTQTPDNSGTNKTQPTTADQQKENISDRQIAAKIRRSVVADKSLSTYGHNVKIIAQNGSVTLKGPVHSEEEKRSIAAKAADVVGQDKVTNQLMVKQ
jgi:hyperosmotically inducible protein